MKILFYPAISLDGFIAKSNGDSDWVTEDDERLFVEAVRKAGCVIVGWRTFKQYEQVIYPIPGTTTFVCTSKGYAVEAPVRSGIRYVGGEVRTIIRQIQADGFISAVLSGGGETNGRFAQAQAIDEIRTSIYPYILGTGLPMFGKLQVRMNLELMSTRQLASGVIQNRYKVIRN